jgi:hypothetical protein
MEYVLVYVTQVRSLYGVVYGEVDDTQRSFVYGAYCGFNPMSVYTGVLYGHS